MRGLKDNFKYEHVRVLSFSMDESMQKTEPQELDINAHITFKFGAQDPKKLGAIVTIEVNRRGEDVHVATLKVLHGFSWLHDEIEGQQLIDEFASAINHISFDTTRGVFHGLFRDSPFKDVVLPIVEFQHGSESDT